MSWPTVRSWLTDLAERDDLLIVDDPVSTKFEIAAYVKKVCQTDGPALRFTDVEGHDYDVVGGLYGSKRRVLGALGVSSHAEAIDLYRTASGSGGIAPTMVKDGPVKEVVETNPDLTEFPIVHHSKQDRGPYITANTTVTHLPHTDTRGQGIHRMYRIDENHLTFFAAPESRIGYAYRKNADDGEPTEMAHTLGAPPPVTFGGISNVPHTVDKYDVAGGILGAPVELVECETVDLAVPAHAEIVIEGRLLPDEQVPEAPFGDFAGTYSSEGTTPVFEVTAITRRENPLYHTVLSGFPPTENNLMNWIPRSATVMADAERAVPGVKAATVRCGTEGGNGMYEAVVSIDKRLDGEAWNVINSVLGGRCQAKYCTVVDDDIDIHDVRELNWARNTRVQPDRDVLTYPSMIGAPLDPSGGNRASSKMGINATIPLDDDYDEYKRVEIPGVDDIELRESSE